MKREETFRREGFTTSERQAKRRTSPSGSIRRAAPKGGELMKKHRGEPFPGADTTFTTAGAIALAVIWGAYTVFFLAHYIYDITN
jgi:hypothetical protein